MELPSENTLSSNPKLKRILMVGIISTSVLSVNFIGLYTLLGTGPSDQLAPLFVLGVGAFFTQFVLLGLVAGFLPYSLPRRMAVPFLLVLTLYIVCKAFEKQVPPRTLERGFAYAIVLGFLISAVFFSGMRAIFGFRLQDGSEMGRQQHESFRHFGIVDILTVTAVVAAALTLLRLDAGAMELALPILVTSFIGFPVLAILYAPLHLFAICDKTKIRLCVFGLFAVVIFLPIVLIPIAFANGGRRDTAPFLFCLTIGSEGTWLIGLGCIRLLGFRLVRTKRQHVAIETS